MKWNNAAMLVGMLGLCAAPCIFADGGSENALEGTSWALVEIQSMDDTIVKPRAEDDFILTFKDASSVQLKVDCNRGTGSYQWSDSGQLQFGPLATTKMMCGPDSIDNRFLSDLSYVRSYVMKEGNLYLATMADGAILEFAPWSED